ncbi:unnamed protein product [Boreogadus saida]
MTIEYFSIEYDANNSKNTFTNGDTITGRIILQVSKKTRIQSLIFRAKGKANVCWHEHYGQNIHVVITSNEKYYDIERPIFTEAGRDEVLGQGRHSFPFSFKLPDRDMPSTFKATEGKVVYQLRAQLSQSMSLSKKTRAKFTFVSKPDMTIPMLTEPQYGCKDQSVTFFASGNISLNISIQKMGYRQGEGLKVVAEISNCSTRVVKPKFVLYEKKSFFAQGRRRVHTHNIVKEKGEEVGSSCTQTVAKTICIPPELPPSILNCSIIKLEYRLKVFLDVTLAKNPEIKLPIIILPCVGSVTTKGSGVEESASAYL